jgi:cytochrome c biogenesis factor
MTAALGNCCLALVVLAATGGALAATASARLAAPWLLRAARGAVYLTAALLTAACLAVAGAILNDDFTLAYVVSYSERTLPAGYKLAALWAGQEGSLLLWAWLLAVLASLAAFLRRKDAPQHQTPVLAILAAICAAFAAMMLFAANPFQLAQAVPLDGEGLNPMLQDPAMIAHPPMLFLGYSALSVPFAVVLGSLVAGRRDVQWVPAARRWAMAAWMFLTIGILLGARWAYVELGWGGYWAWDPVENASLLPWLTATALLHCLIAHHRRGMLKTCTALLAGASAVTCAGLVLRDQFRRYAGLLVHLGMVLLVLGVAGSSLYTEKRDISLGPGQSADIGRYTLRLEGLEEAQGPNYVAGEARLVLLSPDGEQTVLRPQRRRYNKSEQYNTEVAVCSTLREDVYVTLAGWNDSGQTVRIEAIVNPLVNWIWIGGIVMAGGSLACLLRRPRGEAVGAAQAASVTSRAVGVPPPISEPAVQPCNVAETVP